LSALSARLAEKRKHSPSPAKKVPWSPGPPPDLDQQVEQALPWGGFHPEAPSAPTTKVFMTGVTGFLGPELLGDLLTTTAWSFICHVRANDQARADERLARALVDLPSEWRERVRAVPGDISKPRFGLAPADEAAVAEETDAVLHNAANVNLIADYK